MRERALIVNADDFGLSAGINRGIAIAHERGIVTSASLMVRGAAAEEAADYARSRAGFDLGLHVDLGEWRWANGGWEPIYAVVPLDDDAAVAREIDAQVERFHALVGAAPTHIDSHQHVHRQHAARGAAIAVARSLAVPLRPSAGIGYCGEFYGQTTEGASLPAHITVAALAALIGRLPAGVTELACHPGFVEELPTMYRAERGLEVVALCDPAARTALAEAGVILTRFSLLPRDVFVTAPA